MSDYNVLDFGSLQRRANPIFNLMKPGEVPYFEAPGKVDNDIKRATQTQWIRGDTGRDAYNVKAAPNRNGVPETKSRLFQAVEVCEAVKDVDCNKFKDPAFANTCLMTHELGKDSQGNPHKGGLVHFGEDKEDQLNYARSRGRAPAWKATLGEAAIGKVSTDYQSCINLDEKLKCERGKSYELPNCAQCMNGQGVWTRVAPDTEKAEGELVLVGTGNISVTIPGKSTKTGTLSETTPFTVTLPVDAEGSQIYIRVGTQNAMTSSVNQGSQNKIAGYLKGPIANGGESKLDLTFIVQNDMESGARPRFIGYTAVNGFSVNYLRPARGRDSMNLAIYIPFTYIASNEEASIMCPGGPYQTKAASGNKLWQDPCKDGPGKYSLDCLKQRFTDGGCVSDTGGVGDLYPTTEEKAQKLRYDSAGNARTAAQITDFVYQMSIDARTGMQNGQKLSLMDWDKLSRDCYGKPIANPCSGDDQVNGPLSTECIQYLFNNRMGPGRADTIGPTYSEGTPAESLYDQGRYCTKEGTASPYNDNIIQQLQQTGKGVAQVQQYFDQIQQRALNNTLTDTERQEAVKQCYGINFAAEPVIANDPVAIVAGANTKVSLRSGPEPSKYARHAGFIGYKHPYENGTLYRQDSSWVQRPPLNGKPGFVSFESTNYANYFIVNENGRMALRPNDNSITFIRAASWKVGNGQTGGMGCGLPGFESYESDLVPGTFLVTNPATTEIMVKTIATEADSKEACWSRNTPANWPY